MPSPPSGWPSIASPPPPPPPPLSAPSEAVDFGADVFDYGADAGLGLENQVPGADLPGDQGGMVSSVPDGGAGSVLVRSGVAAGSVPDGGASGPGASEVGVTQLSATQRL